MNSNEAWGYIISGGVCLLLLVMGILLINGKGACLLAGYNTMAKEKRAEYDEKALCRFAGWLMFAAIACVLLILAATHFGIAWLAICAGVMTLGLCLGAVVYANTGGRFRKE